MPFAKPYDRHCSLCGQTYRSDAPGARWTNRKGNPRYLHPNCPAGTKPGRGWTPVTAPGITDPDAA